MMRGLSALYCLCPGLCNREGKGRESAAHSTDCPFSPLSLSLALRGEKLYVRIWEWSPVESKGERHGTQLCLTMAPPSKSPSPAPIFTVKVNSG